MSEQGRLQFRAMVQGGIMACIASVITRVLIDKPITEQFLFSGFAVGFAASFFSLSLAFAMGSRRKGTAEGIAWLGFFIPLGSGVFIGFVA